MKFKSGVEVSGEDERMAMALGYFDNVVGLFAAPVNIHLIYYLCCCCSVIRESFSLFGVSESRKRTLNGKNNTNSGELKFKVVGCLLARLKLYTVLRFKLEASTSFIEHHKENFPRKKVLCWDDEMSGKKVNLRTSIPLCVCGTSAHFIEIKVELN